MKLAWKVYFWIFAFIVASGYSTAFSENNSIYGYFDVLLSFLGLVGFYCYTYKKCLARPSLWRKFFCLFFFWNVINIIYGPLHSTEGLIGQKDQLYSKLLSVVISLPAYIALFLYSYRSKEIWRKS